MIAARPAVLTLSITLALVAGGASAVKLTDFSGIQADYLGSSAKQLSIPPSELTHKLLIDTETPIRIHDVNGVASSTDVDTATFVTSVVDPLLCFTDVKKAANPSVVVAEITAENGRIFKLEGLNDQETTAGIGIIHDPAARTIQLNTPINAQCATFTAENAGGVYGDGKLFWHGFEDGGVALPAGTGLSVSINTAARDPASSAHVNLPAGYQWVTHNASGATSVSYDIFVKNEGTVTQSFSLMEYLPGVNNAGYTYLTLPSVTGVSFANSEWVGLQPVNISCAVTTTGTGTSNSTCGNAGAPLINSGVVQIDGITLDAGDSATLTMTRQMNTANGVVVDPFDHATVAVAAFVQDSPVCDGNPDCRAVYSFIAS